MKSLKNLLALIFAITAFSLSFTKHSNISLATLTLLVPKPGNSMYRGNGVSTQQSLLPSGIPNTNIPINENTIYRLPGSCSDDSIDIESVGNIRLRQLQFKADCIDTLVAINGYPIAKSFTMQVISKNGGGVAVDTEVHVFNEQSDALNNVVTTNGSGANSIVYKYPDGFGGRSISGLCRNGRAGMGLVCVGVAMRMLSAGGVANADAIANADAAFVTHSFFNRPLSLPLDMATAQKRPDQDLSLEFIPVEWNIAPTTQFDFLMPAPVAEAGDITCSLTFYFV